MSPPIVVVVIIILISIDTELQGASHAGRRATSIQADGGCDALQAMHDFRDNKATFLLATPAAARGLDLPAVSHVYNLSPPGDAVEYLHRAGRVGRIGASVPGQWPCLALPLQLHSDSQVSPTQSVFSGIHSAWPDTWWSVDEMALQQCQGDWSMCISPVA